MSNNIRDDKVYAFMRETLFKAYNYSKDTSTKVGALIISGETFEVRSSGYNGMPRGCDDHKPERLIRPEKYLWFEHAERNAIYNAAKVGTPLDGTVLFVTLTPCMDCARAIIQSGIKGVVSLSANRQDLLSRWEGHFDKTDELFSEVGVWHRSVSPDELLLNSSPDDVDFLKKILRKTSI